MRITFDTREDRYEDALGVLRRAYGRHRLAPKVEESPAPLDLGSDGVVGQAPGNRSATGAGQGDAELRKPPAKKARKSTATKLAPAVKADADSPVSKPTVKRASGKKAARHNPGQGRPGSPRKRSASRVAANTAPRGQSEAVRAWALEQGMQVSTRGRMPAKVISAYLDAHSD